MKNILLVLALITGAAFNAKSERTICIEYLDGDDVEFSQYESETACKALCEGTCQ